MEKSTIDRLFPDKRDFLAEAKERILVIDEVISELTDERAKLVGIVRLYEPPVVATNTDKVVPPLPVVPDPVPSSDSNTTTVAPLSDKSEVNREQSPNIKQSSKIVRHKDSLPALIMDSYINGQLVLEHHSTIAKKIGKETPKDSNKNVRRALAYLKDTKKLVSFIVQRPHPRYGNIINTPLFGLPKLFTDSENGLLLPEYEEIAENKVHELGFILEKPSV